MCDDTKHFDLTVFINASQDLHQENTFGAFTVDLAQPIELGPSEKMWGYVDSYIPRLE